MKPLNTPERKKAFLNYILFYTITTGLIVLAVYFGMRVPFKENDRLNAQLDVYEKEKDFAMAFSKGAGEVKSMLDSINRSGVQTELLDGQIAERLNTLNLMIDKDSTSVKKLYQDIVQNYADLKAAKKQLRDASGKDANLSQYLQQIETLKSDLNAARAENNTLRLQLMSTQR